MVGIILKFTILLIDKADVHNFFNVTRKQLTVEFTVLDIFTKC